MRHVKVDLTLVRYSNTPESKYIAIFENGKRKFNDLINIMIKDLNLSDEENKKSKMENNELSDKIFIVHGHNDEMKHSVARFITMNNLKPIILHEQPNKGRTIIQKFKDYSDVSFAIVLLSADDKAYPRNKKSEDWKYRARQNVILELGFFLGTLNEANVVVLHEKIDNFDIPSDYKGVLFIEYDKNDDWKFKIVKELKAVGFGIDANLLT